MAIIAENGFIIGSYRKMSSETIEPY